MGAPRRSGLRWWTGSAGRASRETGESWGGECTLSRRPVNSSLLSYAGASDPGTGISWGGVRANGVRLDSAMTWGGSRLLGQRPAASPDGQKCA
ncbi:cellulose synthase subunit BcsC-related outer membrane protein [Aeromonas sp. A-5]|uniref:cellulose synthase subunit BcsC-related outer membrane protein n=1 Tax=Aeromonas ichthyocola TaxID=3367746 RepID=UPI0038E01D7E